MAPLLLNSHCAPIPINSEGTPAHWGGNRVRRTVEEINVSVKKRKYYICQSKVWVKIGIFAK